MLTDAELTLAHITRLDRWHLVCLRNAALRVLASLPRCRLVGSGWSEDLALKRVKLVMATNDCEARLAGRKLGGHRARRDWHTSRIGQAKYLA